MKIKNHPETYVVVPKVLLKQVLLHAWDDNDELLSEHKDKDLYDQRAKLIRELWQIAGLDDEEVPDSTTI